jgi:hypothetical protein
MPTRNEALLEAVLPLRQADFSLVRETMEVMPSTQTARLIKQVLENLIGYFETEKDMDPAGTDTVTLNSTPELYVSKKDKRKKK